MTDTESETASSNDTEQSVSCCPGLAVCKRLGPFCALLLALCAAYIGIDATTESPSGRGNAAPASLVPPQMQVTLQLDKASQADLQTQTSKTVDGRVQDLDQFSNKAPQVNDNSVNTEKAEKSMEADGDETDQRYRQMVVGTWEDDYQGKRVMQIRSDGTATMDVTLSGLKATLFAKHLKFEMKWSIQDGRLLKQTTGGEPAGRVSLILKTMGDRVNEPIVELTKERLLLLDADGQTKYDWRRVEAPEK